MAALRSWTVLVLSLGGGCLLPEVAVTPADAGVSAPVVVLGDVFAQWPMPDATQGAKTAPSYSATRNTVEDSVTQLVWQRSLPEAYAGCAAESGAAGDGCSWRRAAQYCEDPALAATLGGTGWRLPTKVELESILDATRKQPAIDPAFADTPGARFWSASPYAGASGYAWCVDFTDGLVDYYNVDDALRVRCVRSR